MKTKKITTITKASAIATALLSLQLTSTAQSWNTTLNSFPAGQNANFGTLGNNSILFKTNNTTRMTMSDLGKINIPDLAGDGNSLIMVDATGNVQRVAYQPPIACGTGINPWNIGGNTATVVAFTDYNSIGTCNGIPFLLKANNVKTIALQTNGKIGFGPGNDHSNQVPLADFFDPANSNTNHLKLHANAAGAIETSSDMALYNNSGNFGIYNGSLSSPSGRLLIDNFGTTNFYNTGDFVINTGTPANPQVKLYVDGNGETYITEHLNIGNTSGSARLAVNATAGTGLLLNGGNNNDAIRLSNGAGAARLRVWVNTGGGEDTKFHMAGSTQIGFLTSTTMLDNTVRLNVDADNIDGIKVSTNNHLNKMLHVNYNNNVTFEVQGSGKTFIGGARPDAGGVAAGAMLTVDGMILARDIRVSNSTGTHWADFVFEKGYKLMPLSDIENYVSKNKHLPGVPSESEVKKNGVDLMEMNVQLLQKVEELYLYTIQLQKQIDELKAGK